MIVAMLLIVTPAMAKVTITVRDMNCGTVQVSYDCNLGTKVRAFALDIATDNNTVIAGIRDFNRGENDTYQHCGYGIFPGKFRDFINPADPCWVDGNYNPVAPIGDLDANTGLGTKAITVELGSLFVAGRDPCNSGILFNLDIRPTGNMPTKSALRLSVNQTRGGVVDINGNQLLTDANILLATGSGEVNFPQCFPCWTGMSAQYGQWVSMWKPRCWCGQYVSTGITTNANNWRSQCQGDADGKYETAFKYRVYTSDYTKLIAAWALKATALKAIGPNEICTDFDHQYETAFKYRVYTSDYTKLIAGWAKKETNMKPWCPSAL